MRRRNARASLCGLLLLLASCARAPVAGEHGPSKVEFADRRVGVVAEQLAQARGLAWKAPVKVVRLPDDVFATAFRVTIGAEPSPSAVEFFDAQRDTVNLREKGLFHGPEADTAALVHGLAAALALQNFPSLDVPTRTRDSLWARSAVRAGEAALSEALWRRANGASGPDPVAALATAPVGESNLSNDADDRALHAIGPPFVAAVYASGGLAAVNRLLADPPKTTAEILHPERYLSGEPPLLVPIPTPPSTVSRVEFSGRDTAWSQVSSFPAPVGELRLRWILTQCLARPNAEALAAQLAGDALLLGSRSGGDAVVRWTTVWRSGPAARSFASLADVEFVCLSAAVRGLSRLQSVPDAAHVVQRSGRVVTLAIGPSEPAELSLMAAVLSPELVAEPLDDELLPTLDGWAPSGPGREVNAELGLTASVPDSFEVKSRVDRTLVLQAKDDPAAGLTVRFVRHWTEKGVVGLVNDAADAVAAALQPKARADFVRSGNFSGSASFGALGTGIDNLYRMRERPEVWIRVVAVPVCGGEGLDLVTETWTRPEDGASADRALQGFAASDSPPICASL